MITVVIDVDGTLSCCDHRAHHLDTANGKEPNWDKFLDPELVRKDLPILAAKRSIEHFKNLKMTILVLTGRNEALRDVTSTWLIEHFDLQLPDTHLLMRPKGNMMTATSWKREQCIEIKREFGDSLIFIDDDLYVHPVYAEFGLALHAPECWTTMYPIPAAPLPLEEAWRR